MRKDSLRNITENLGYDLFDQLKWSKVTGLDSLKMDYDDIGNITSKSDVGDYYYNSTRIHAVDSISGGQYPGRQNIEYNFFNKPVYIADAEDSLNYAYSVLDNRIKATLYGTGGLVRSTWYAGLYEKTIENSITKHYYYINGPDGPIALAIQTGSGIPELYYLCKDHLGSITGIMNSSGNLVEEYNYDAWGRRRNPDDWSYDSIPAVTYTHHGFTSHEHLDMFNLINMNGRVYDSEIARFISPDPIIQDPYNILSYNRYTYYLNNPLKYVDPSGYVVLKSWKEFWDVVNDLLETGGSWNSDSGYEGGGYGVPSGSGFQGPGQPYMLGEVTVTDKAPEKNTSSNKIESVDPIDYFINTWNPDDRAGGYNNGSFTNGLTGSLDLVNAVATGLKPIKTATTLAGVLLGATNMGLITSNNKVNELSWGDKARIAYNGVFTASDVMALGSGLILSILDSYGVFEYDYQQWDVFEKTDYWVYYNKWTGKWEKKTLPFLKKVLP